MSDPTPVSDPALDSVFQHALANWDDPRAHSAVLEQARALNQLAEAAALYRRVQGDHKRKEVADKMLAAIAVTAFAAIDASKSPVPKIGPIILGASLVVLVILTITVLLSL